MKIDLTIVGGSRPELLSRTLGSFNKNMFVNFQIGSVFVNLDPFGGNEEDRAECIKILNSYFLNPEILCPEISSFGLAVKNLWSKPKTLVFFHLEDDWELNIVITPKMIKPMKRKSVAQLALRYGKYHRFFHEKYHWQKKSIFGFDIFPNFLRPVFTTSPSFIKSAFANVCSDLMNPQLDPEKQLSNGMVPGLSFFTADYKCKFLLEKSKIVNITDTGREWRLQKGLVKIEENGKSMWLPKSITDSTQE